MKVSAVQYSTMCNNIHVYVSVELSNLDTRNMEMNKICLSGTHTNWFVLFNGMAAV